MFIRMLKGALWRQKSRMLMIAFTIALGTSLAVAMLNVMLDVGDKINRELKAYGANIQVVPRASSVLSDLYDVTLSDQFLKESDLGKIKTIFWAFNIVDFAPFLNTAGTASASGQKAAPIPIKGTWFKHHLTLPTTEEFDAGMIALKAWWEVEGAYPADDRQEEVMAGSALAKKLGLSVGSALTVTGAKGSYPVKVVGIFTSGDEDDECLFTNLDLAQEIAARDDAVSFVEVSALTTPDNELAIKAAQNPKALSLKEMETWYCTAYVSSICYQIEEAIPGTVAKAVRQIAGSEGEILDKTKLLMLLITFLSLLGASLGISNLVTASVMERSKEIGLLKALGATNFQVTGLILTDLLVTALIGAAAGFFIGLGFAQIIGSSVFDASISLKVQVIPISAFLVLIVTLLGSVPALRTITRLRPAFVLHGGH